MADSESFLREWHRVVERRDVDGLKTLLADDIAIGAPPYWQKLRGLDLVHYLLTLILATIEDFTYHREWQQGRELALEFHGHIGDLDLQGIDLITLDDDGRISNLDVLIRPANAVEALIGVIRPKMTAFLSGDRA